MKTSPKGTALLHSFEDLRLRAYPDPQSGGEPWSIGWGNTQYADGRKVRPGDVITKQRADDEFAFDLIEFEAMVDKAVTVPLTQGQFDALVSIVYNVGPGNRYKSGILRLKSGAPSTLLKKLNAGDYRGAADQFDLWISKGTPAERGLRRRRAAEKALFLS
ncbi:MAG: endolysin/autolysin [Bacteriophage sp.]|nr:MAG: endolysin/autolysin [Bacteriophage sp.]